MSKECKKTDKAYLKNPDGVVCNPATGKWVKKDGPKGKFFAAAAAPAVQAPKAVAVVQLQAQAQVQQVLLDTSNNCKNLKVETDLKPFLKLHGVSTVGKKADLCDRAKTIITKLKSQAKKPVQVQVQVQVQKQAQVFPDTSKDCKNLKVETDLKPFLKNHGESTTGKKAELCERAKKLITKLKRQATKQDSKPKEKVPELPVQKPKQKQIAAPALVPAPVVAPVGQELPDISNQCKNLNVEKQIKPFLKKHGESIIGKKAVLCERLTHLVKKLERQAKKGQTQQIKSPPVQAPVQAQVQVQKQQQAVPLPPGDMTEKDIIREVKKCLGIPLDAADKE